MAKWFTSKVNDERRLPPCTTDADSSICFLILSTLMQPTIATVRHNFRRAFFNIFSNCLYFHLTTLPYLISQVVSLQWNIYRPKRKMWLTIFIIVVQYLHPPGDKSCSQISVSLPNFIVTCNTIPLQRKDTTY